MEDRDELESSLSVLRVNQPRLRRADVVHLTIQRRVALGHGRTRQARRDLLHVPDVIVGVRVAGVVRLVCRQQLLGREMADRLEQPVPHVVGALVELNERLVDQAREEVDDAPCVLRVRRADRLRGFEGEGTREDRESAEQGTFLVAEQVDAPADGGFECALPGERGARASTEQRESFLELLRDLVGAQRATTTGCGELDRERQPVEPTADRRDRVAVLV